MKRFQKLWPFQRPLALALFANLFFLLICFGSSYAGDGGKTSYRAYTGFMPLVGGDANTGSTTSITGTGTTQGLTFTGTATITFPTQKYSDVYIGGIPLILEYAYRYNSQWSAMAGIGFQYFPAKEFDAVNISATGTLTTSGGTSFAVAGATTVRGELDDMYRIPIYVGGLYHFYDSGSSSFSPYIRIDGGVIFQPAVDITVTVAGTSATEKFWIQSFLGLVDAGIGVEGQIGSVGTFGEVRVQYTSAPTNADALGKFAEADGVLSIPIIVGLTF